MKKDPTMWTDADCEFLKMKVYNLRRNTMFMIEPVGVRYNL